MRSYLAKCAWLGIVAFFLSTTSQALPLGGGVGVVTQRTTDQTMRDAGINWDDKSFIDPICGVVIEWPRSTPPIAYDGGRNPWGRPTMKPMPPPATGWIVTFGGPNGPCFSRSNPIFYQDGDVNKDFLGLHLGFYAAVSFKTFMKFPCFWIGENNKRVPCSGITGYSFDHRGVSVVNDNPTQIFAMRNVAIAGSRKSIAINDLNRLDLPELDWRPVTLENNILPAAEGGLPGTLTLGIPEDLRQQNGFVVFSYDITDPQTFEVYSTVTLEVAVQ